MNKEEIHETTLEEYSHAINKYIDIMDCEDAYKINDYVSNLEYDNKKYKEVIDKAIEYISNKKAIINTDVIRIFDLFEIDEQGYTDELLNILKEMK